MLNIPRVKMFPLLVRIFDVDFYLSAPVAKLDVTFSQFRGSAIHQVPVIRVFGSTEFGKKICVHIHGVFPYFYIPYDGSEPASGLMYKIASNLDKAINISLGQASSNNQHIYKIALVSGIPFYGYHYKKHQFFKVYLYNPMLIKRVNNLLFNESVLGKIYQPHETHLNFTLQFMIDYNLHGMSNIILSEVKFRNENGVDAEFVEETLSKVSSCELECDTLSEYILNRQEIESGNLAANPGIAALWEDEKQRLRNKGENSQLPQYLSLSRMNVFPTESHEVFKKALRENLAISSQDPNRNDVNLSVYPAECLENESEQNCSMVDFHSPYNSQSNDSELDRTLVNDTLNLTVDEDVQELLNILKDLEKNFVVEEDSILSQVSKNDVEEMEEDYDMSISIEAGDGLLNKTIKFSQRSEDSDEDVENTTLVVGDESEKKLQNIPQLDGNCEEFVVNDCANTISHHQDQSEDMLSEFKMEKDSYSSTRTNRKMILCTEENNNVSLDCLLKLQNQKNWATNEEITCTLTENTENSQSFRLDKSVVFEIKILNEDVEGGKYSLKYELPGCKLNHKYPHLEESMNMQLYQSNIVEKKKSNHEIIQLLMDKEHSYFSADSIGERVVMKNSVKRKKLVLKNYLEYPCELVVVGTKIHLPHLVKKKRDMPLLDDDLCGSDTNRPLLAICRWRTMKRLSQNNNSNSKKMIAVKKSIVRQRFSGRREELHRNFYKKKLLVQKFCKEFEENLNKLEKGAKPTFRVVPGYRPYVFEPIKKVVSIQTLKQSTDSIHFSSTVISNGVISSNTHIEQENSKERDFKDEVTKPISPKRSAQKRSRENNKCEINNVNSATNKSSFKRGKEKTNKDKKGKMIEENEEETDKEKKSNANTSLKKSSTEKVLLRNIEEIFKAQKVNEECFFRSVYSLMDHCTISENKLLGSMNGKDTNLLKKDFLFLDGANDDSDEEDLNQLRTRSCKKARSTYSSLPIFKSTHSSGRSTPIVELINLKKKEEPKLTLRSVMNENMMKIKRRINFDSSSHIDNKVEKISSLQVEVSKLSGKTGFTMKPYEIKAVNNNSDQNSNEISTDHYSSTLFRRENDIGEYSGENIERIGSLTITIENTNDSHHIDSYRSDLNSNPLPKLQKNSHRNNDMSHPGLEGMNLTTAQLYDIINNYDPQEGSSKSYYSCRGPVTPENTMKNRDFGGIPKIKSENVLSGSTIKTSSSDMLYSNGPVFYKPLHKAPTRLYVFLSLPEFGIPLIRPQEPFYSDVEDASGSMEIGYNTLKIKTLTTMDAPDFESSFKGLDHCRKKFNPHVSNSGKKENLKYLYCPPGNCLLVPLKGPPTYSEVQIWLKQNSVPKKEVEKPKPKKRKVYFSSSQDIFSDDDVSMDLSLTSSPCTPKTDTTISDTPRSNVSRRVSVPREKWSKKRKTNYKYSDSQESNVNSDTCVREDTNEDVTLTPRSSHSGRGDSPVLTKTTLNKKLNRSITLRKSAHSSQSSEHSGVISGVSLENTYGFQCSVQNYQDARASVKYEYLTILSMELHVNTRGEFKPNPQYDSIQAIFYSIFNDIEENDVKPRRCEGFFAINPTSEESNSAFLDGTGISHDIIYVKNELELFEEFTKFIIRWDPDILLGYEIQMLSWGFFIERCFHLGINVIPQISRVKDKHLKFNEKETGDLRVSGRVVLDLWRLLRHEVALQSYTIQSTVYEILQRRIPKYSFQDLTTWWSHQSSLFRHRTVDYYITCVRCQLKILEQLDFVGRTSELARLFGIQFYEVLSRGSQFRVESMMLRLAKPMNYVAVSPSVQQRANMKAPEYIALVLEPESKLYTDPVIVLDFQSLYPSIIIAYNYCYSTCVGRVNSLGENTPFEFGATNLRVSKERVKHLLQQNLLNFSPCGVAFVKKDVRDGIMPRMLREILDTRLMVKKSMKSNKEDVVLQKVLHNRQLGLKLIANVTYGYTAANFSGRMPSVELGDSIVSKARETLQRAISLVDNNKEWGVRVVYGDTDSLFVHCPGKTRNEAFSIGEEIVEAVGRENPDPVKLKLEKVYQPCILQTKKRYVGYMYESPDQKEPLYDAKGIETVRRDGCPAVSKMLEKTLRILFETKDVSKVKKYCLKQFSKIIMGRITIKDLTFAKEFRGFTGYRPGACVPSLELAKKWVAIDKRAEPRRGERVPYVIINGPPGLPLIRLVRSPHELLKDSALKPNALYYITRVIIPPLNRCFNLIGADLQHWFLQMPRKQLHYLPTATSPTKRSTISQYFVSTLCAVCGTQTQNGLCDLCVLKPQETITILNERARKWEASYNNCKLICNSCTQILDDPGCISLDCPVLYRLNQTGRDLQQADHVRHLLSQHFDVIF